MSKAKPSKETRDRKEQSKEPTKVQTVLGFRLAILRAVLRNLGIAILWASAMLGLVSGWVSLIPRISVSQNDPINVADPFSAPFVVANDGPLGINDVRFSCLLISVRTAHNNAFINVRVDAGSRAQWIGPGEKAAVPCPFRHLIGLSPEDVIVQADIAMFVNFRPDFVPYIRPTRTLRFITLRKSDGNLYWYPQPISEAPKHNY